MSTVKLIKYLGIILAILLIYEAIKPFIAGQVIDTEIKATSIIFLCIAVGYIITVFKPSWLKAILFLEGLVIAFSGYITLAFPYNYVFVIVGIILFVIAILAYKQMLPNNVLKYFYRS